MENKQAVVKQKSLQDRGGCTYQRWRSGIHVLVIRPMKNDEAVVKEEAQEQLVY